MRGDEIKMKGDEMKMRGMGKGLGRGATWRRAKGQLQRGCKVNFKMKL